MRIKASVSALTAIGAVVSVGVVKHPFDNKYYPATVRGDFLYISINNLTMPFCDFLADQELIAGINEPVEQVS